MEIAGVVAVVTGGGSGLGAAAARLLAEKGARVGLLDTHTDGAEGLAREIGGVAAHCDVTDPASAGAALAEVTGRLGGLRVLVNCAGITIGRVPLVGPEADARWGAFGRVVRVNLIGTLTMISLVAERMAALDPLAEGERGVIVSTASISAFDGQVGTTACAASKGGVVALTLPAARELAPWGIRVNAVAPGNFDTPLVGSLPDSVREGCRESFLYPVRFGAPREYADLVVHIVENRMLNAETIRLDGGARLPPSFERQRPGER